MRYDKTLESFDRTFEAVDSNSLEARLLDTARRLWRDSNSGDSDAIFLINCVFRASLIGGQDLELGTHSRYVSHFKAPISRGSKFKSADTTKSVSDGFHSRVQSELVAQGFLFEG